MRFDERGFPVYDDWTAEAQDALYSQFKIIDPTQVGIPMDRLRTFYPYMGWNDIQKGVGALVASGRLTEAPLTPAGGTVAIMHYFWRA